MRAKFSDVLNIINGRNQKKVENPNGFDESRDVAKRGGNIAGSL